jgi:hypothetical protein
MGRPHEHRIWIEPRSKQLRARVQRRLECENATLRKPPPRQVPVVRMSALDLAFTLPSGRQLVTLFEIASRMLPPDGRETDFVRFCASFRFLA